LVSIIAMVASEEGSNESLKFCLLGTKRNLVEWGHEFLHSLSGEISKEYNKRVESQIDSADLMNLVEIIIPFYMKNHEEPEAVDLLMEVESLDKLLQFISDSNFERVCLYLLSCAQYAADPEEMMKAFKTAYTIYMGQKKYPQALRVAQKINDINLIKEVMDTC
jgi:26S proteasome regulatory subunit N1